VCDDPNLVDPALHHIRDNHGAREFLDVGGYQAGQSRLFTVAVIFHVDKVLENTRAIKTEDPVLFPSFRIIRETATP